MAVKLYGAAMSTCTSSVLACLLEKEAEFELVPVDLMGGEHKQPSFLTTKNPFGQIPALEDGDFTIFESRAINRYIASKNKDKGTDLLRLGNIKEAAMVDVWVEVEAHNYNPVISAIFYQLIIIPMLGKPIDQQVVAANVEKLGQVLDVYEKRLSVSKYLAGDFYSLADLHHIPYTYYLMKTDQGPLLIDKRPHVRAWWNDIISRPASKKVAAGMTLA